MRISILIFFLRVFASLEVGAQCNPGQLKISIAENIPICLTLTDGLHIQHRVARAVWNNTVLSYEIPIYICQGNNTAYAECGFTMDTGVCYFLQPFDWNITDPQAMQLKLNSDACTSGMNGMQIEYSQTNRQYNISSTGNSNAYSLNNCRACQQDVIWDQNSLLNEGLLESSTWIKSNNLVSTDPNGLTRVDANSLNGYIELNDGFTSIPQNGIFIASCDDGCGPLDPFHKQMNLTVWLQGYYSTFSHAMVPALLNQGINAGAAVTDYLHLSLRDTNNSGTLFETDAIIDTQGRVSTAIPYGIQNAVFVSIKHRNSVETFSSFPWIEIPMEYAVYFSDAETKAYGSNQIELEPGQYAVYSGDINQDGVIDGLDYNDWELDKNNFGTGYLATDLNGDGIVDGLDFLFWEVNGNNFVGAVTP